MYLLRHDNTTPAWNLALEEYVLTRLTGSFVLLWRNARAVIIGRNQNAAEEIDAGYAREHHISVNRRISGGGAVFHDLGNINYTVIKNQGENDFSNYAEFAGPVLGFLATLGISAELSGRNDLTIDNMKISGNAQASKGGRIMHHGTLLYNINVGDLAGVLRPSEAKISSKGIKSVRSRVTNIMEHMPEKMTVDAFMERLYQYYLTTLPDVKEYTLTAEDKAAVDALVAEKFGQWEWNIGHSPAFDLQNNRRFPFGTVDVRLRVADGIMGEVKIYGDFFGMEEVAGLEAQLTGVRHHRESIAAALENIDLGVYIHGITKEEFLGLLLPPSP